MLIRLFQSNIPTPLSPSPTSDTQSLWNSKWNYKPEPTENEKTHTRTKPYIYYVLPSIGMIWSFIMVVVLMEV
ncbi:unnamed protein product [Lactuca virosa]|uniref:Uncharacterized protein n=1 Tax=Lactuca virosa TaxID=75947 RepID=A0AAU9PUQ3_9ASTR|nr:unnamed protein product [Lactuca virosa]